MGLHGLEQGYLYFTYFYQLEHMDATEIWRTRGMVRRGTFKGDPYKWEVT
jgi:hypothetical protein